MDSIAHGREIKRITETGLRQYGMDGDGPNRKLEAPTYQAMGGNKEISQPGRVREWDRPIGATKRLITVE